MNRFTHRVLVVDDEPMVCELVRAALASADDLECVGQAADGEEAVGWAAREQPDVVVMDVDMPRLDGPRATERITTAQPSVRVLAHTGHVDPERVTRMILAGAIGYVVKGSEPQALVDAVRHAARRAPHVDQSVLPSLFESLVNLAREERHRRREAERLNGELHRSFHETVHGLMAALESRDGYTGGHDDRVGQLSRAVAQELGITGKELEDVEYGALFHDIGKIAIPDSILHGTSAQLCAEEWEVVKTHTVVGERIMRPMRFLRGAAKVVRHSHEHWDGSGYPDGLSGEDIPLGSRIVLACDAFDAMTTDRTYRAGMSVDDALCRLRELAAVHFDPDVVEALCEEIDRTAERAAQPAATSR